MKVWKLVSGILCIVFFCIIIFQSCAAGLVNAIEDNGETSGSAGAIFGFLLLAGGIISISTRNKGGKSNIALIVLFGLASLIGFTMAGNYGDLVIWAVWSLICAVLAIVSLIKS